jgi:hypothetical protein
MCAWYLTFASVLLNWWFRGKGQNSHAIPGISTDLLAVVLYAVFAATDLLIQAIRFLEAKGRALAIFCVLFPVIGDVEPGRARVELLSIPTDILSIGQRATAISGPLKVCHMFATIMSIPLTFALLGIRDIRPSRTTGHLTYLIYGYVSLILTIFHLSIGDIVYSFALWILEAYVTPLISSAMVSVFFGLPVGFCWLAWALYVSAGRSVRSVPWWLLLIFASGALFEAVIALCSYMAFQMNFMSWIPDLGQNLTDKDQLAAMLVGILTFGFTLVSILRRRKHSEADPEERQGLIGP